MKKPIGDEKNAEAIMRRGAGFSQGSEVLILMKEVMDLRGRRFGQQMQ